MLGKQVTVVVPVLEEASNIVPLLRTIEKSLRDYDWHVIYVDDDSSDGSFQQVQNLARTNSRVRGILRVNERGLATAAIAGMLSAHSDYIVVMDGDGQHDASTIPRLLAPLISGEKDIVSAARRFDDVDTLALSTGRQLLSKSANSLAEKFVRRQIKDPMTGYFAITQEAFHSVVRQLGDAGFKLLLDILICGANLRHQEVEFGFTPRVSGESKLDAKNVWILITFLLARLTKNLIPQHFISFVAVGSIGLLVHFSILYSMMEMVSFPVAQTTATVVATIFNFLLNNVLTFRDLQLRGWPLLIGLFKYLVISSVGIAANVAVATQVEANFTEYFAFSALAGISIDTVWKYCMSKLIIWRKT